MIKLYPPGQQDVDGGTGKTRGSWVLDNPRYSGGKLGTTELTHQHHLQFFYVQDCWRLHRRPHWTLMGLPGHVGRNGWHVVRDILLLRRLEQQWHGYKENGTRSLLGPESYPFLEVASKDIGNTYSYISYQFYAQLRVERWLSDSNPQCGEGICLRAI